jgi:ABC-2 type transport system permease protein
MRKVMHISLQEFRKNVFRRRFIGVLLFPLVIVAIIIVVGLVTVSTMGRFGRGQIGLVDPDNILPDARNPDGAAFVFVRLPGAASARAALERQDVSAYVVLGQDFLSSGRAALFYWKDEPDTGDLRQALERYRNAQLLSDLPADAAARASAGTAFTFETPDQTRSVRSNDFPTFVVPLVLTIFFIISLFGGAQYLMQAVLDEKENRTMEIVVTSVTPTQLMAGKVSGLGAVGLVQMMVWLAALAFALAILGPRLPFLQSVMIKPDFIALAVVLFVLEYLMLGSFMAAIGSMVVDAKQGQNYSAPFTLIAMIPMFFLVVILFDPNGVIAVLLSLFPLTSPLTMLVRYGMTSVPAWQVGLSILLLAASAGGAMWLAGRIFRIGMLRFDTGVKWSEVAASIRI